MTEIVLQNYKDAIGFNRQIDEEIPAQTGRFSDVDEGDDEISAPILQGGACEQPNPARINSSMRPLCLHTDACKARGFGKHCQSCAATANNRDPHKRRTNSASMKRWYSDATNAENHRAVTTEAIRKSIQDPDMREARSQAGKLYGQHNLVKTRTPEVRAKAGRAISAARLAHIPTHLRAAYRELMRTRLCKAEEAERIVRESAEQEAKREIAKVNAKMRAKYEREQREAY